MARKVLIVDDEPNIVISLEFLMARNGFEIRTATNGREALEQVESFRPDLVLLDVMMPEKSGFEVCQQIREKDEFSEMKIILLTARGREQDVTQGMALGADDYITKPFSTRNLTEKVKELLGGEIQ